MIRFQFYIILFSTNMQKNKALKWKNKLLSNEYKSYLLVLLVVYPIASVMPRTEMGLTLHFP